MAKALLGHLYKHSPKTTVHALENIPLRPSVTDLEALVLRLQADNDRLAAAVRDETLTVEELQPV